MSSTVFRRKEKGKRSLPLSAEKLSNLVKIMGPVPIEDFHFARGAGEGKEMGKKKASRPYGVPWSEKTNIADCYNLPPERRG